MFAEIEGKINQIVSGFNQLPYLFVGTGLSMRYSDAPSWNDLLKNIWMKVNNEDEIKYKKFLNSISYNLGINKQSLDDDERKYYLNPQVATEIQRQFDDKFYRDDSFEKSIFSNDEVNNLISNEYDPFKFYIANKIANLKVNYNNEKAFEIDFIKKNKNKIAGVITTNYDHILEGIFSDFGVVIGQDNLLTSNTNNIFNIFKIHGSSDNPDSIVITAEDYEYFKNKLKYLSAKLLTLFVEHPIIFMGYSIGDLNIRSILEEIAQCLNEEQLEQMKENFIFISQCDSGKEEIRYKEINFSDKRILMTEIMLDDFSMIFKSLESIESSMPVKIIRQLQDMVCNFIVTTKPTKNIMVGNIDDPNISNDQVGIYIGQIQQVLSMGFDSYGIEEIMEDILFNNRSYLMDKQIIDKTFRRIRSSAGTTYLPVYKYVNGLNMNIEDLSEKWHIINEKDIGVLNSNQKAYTKGHEVYTSIKDIETTYPNHLPRQYAYLLYNIEKINIDEIGLYLCDKYEKYKNHKIKKEYSTFKRLVAIYDYLKYKK